LISSANKIETEKQFYLILQMDILRKKSADFNLVNFRCLC